MGLSDRDYMTPGPTEPDDDRPAKPKWWVVIVALVLVVIFLAPILLQFL